MSCTLTDSAPTTAQTTARRVLRPRYEAVPRGDDYVVRVYVPGVRKDAVHVTFEDDTLRVRASRQEELPAGWRPLYRESAATDFALDLGIQVEVEATKIAAQLADGVLEVTLPKAEATKPRSITVA